MISTWSSGKPGSDRSLRATAGDVENLISLPPGWFASRAADVVQLKQDVTRSPPQTEGAGVVVPFSRVKER